MIHSPQWLLAIASASLLAYGAGCSRQASTSQPSERELLTKLPATMATGDAELRQELERLEQAGQLPWQRQAQTVPPTDNAAAVLARQFTGLKAEPLAAEAAPLLATGLEYSLTEQETARALLDRFEAQRMAARESLSLPHASFGIDPAAGLLAELDCIGQARLIVRLEALATALALGRLGPIAASGAAADVADAGAGPRAATDRPGVAPNLDQAVAAVDAAIRWVDCLAREPHPICRLESVHLRGEALLALEAVAQHPEITSRHLQQLEESVKQSLTQWPADAEVCYTERVLGMQMYELIRNGQPQAVQSNHPPPADEADLVRRVRKMTPEQIDRDQLFYLRAIDGIARDSRDDFPDRQQAFEALRVLAGPPDADTYPVIAMGVLLNDLDRLHQFLTYDRARMEAWAVALAAARGEQSPALGVSPRTGEPYRVDERPDRVAVWGHGSLEGNQGERPIVARKGQP